MSQQVELFGLPCSRQAFVELWLGASKASLVIVHGGSSNKAGMLCCGCVAELHRAPHRTVRGRVVGVSPQPAQTILFSYSLHFVSYSNSACRY